MTMLVRGGAIGAGSALPASATTGQVLQWNGSAWVAATPSASGTTPNATTTVPGLVQLAGDLGGTATAPTVAKINGATPAAVATSGSYTDLTGRPLLAPVATSGSYGDLTGRPLLATVATSGSYTDLTGRPTIPAAPLTAYKTAQTLLFSSTQTPDPHLAFAAVPTGTYLLEVDGTNLCGASGINIAWTVTGSATFTGNLNGTQAWGSAVSGAQSSAVVTAAAGGTLTNAGGVNAPFRVAVPLVVTAAGSLAFTWAQAVTNAGNAGVLNAGCAARLTKVA